jgi:hypothetical protein
VAHKRPEITEDEVRQVRKALWWTAPVFFTFAALPLWLFFSSSFAIIDVIANEPMVSVWPMSTLAVPLALMMLVALATGIFRALPWPIAHARAERIGLALGFVCIATIVLALVFANPLQNYIMPKYGYYKCERTEVGATRVWFTDWVKHPKWCVPGKKLDWVREQAAKERLESNKPIP